VASDEWRAKTPERHYAAKCRITLVSFAVYKISNIGKALMRELKRGVKLTVCCLLPYLLELNPV
jgi:hypothetical protein